MCGSMVDIQSGLTPIWCQDGDFLQTAKIRRGNEKRKKKETA